MRTFVLALGFCLLGTPVWADSTDATTAPTGTPAATSPTTPVATADADPQVCHKELITGSHFFRNVCEPKSVYDARIADEQKAKTEVHIDNQH